MAGRLTGRVLAKNKVKVAARTMRIRMISLISFGCRYLKNLSLFLFSFNELTPGKAYDNIKDMLYRRGI
jgi:hypothetical protein